MSDDTGIFIYPGYKFKITDALITNFHLPESTLLMLVSAFAGRERMLEDYRHRGRGGLPLLQLRRCDAYRMKMPYGILYIRNHICLRNVSFSQNIRNAVDSMDISHARAAMLICNSRAAV